MKKIDIMIIGAQKAGTSSLKKYLAQYPDFCTHDTLEFTYFVNNDEYEEGYEGSFQRHFQSYKEGNKIVAKSVGIMYLPESLKRLKEHNPDVKVVIVLRHPVERAYSAYWYARRYGWETIEVFEESIKADQSRFNGRWLAKRFCDYIERSDYFKHIYRIYKIFDPAQVHIILTDEMNKDTVGVCKSIMEGFGYDASPSIDVRQKYNRSALPKYNLLTQMFTDKNPMKKFIKVIIPSSVGKKIKRAVIKMNEREFTPPPIRRETRAELLEYFKEGNEKLSKLIKKDLSYWNK